MEYEPLMIELIKKTSRLFYDPGQIVILDILIKNLVLFDYEISERLKMLPKEFNKAIVRLKEDRIVSCESKIDNTDSNTNISSNILPGLANKGFIRTVYYLDYCKIRDIIKYKIFKMHKKSDVTTKKCIDEALLYICKICKREFSLFEIQALMNNEYKFKCDECLGDLEENNLNSGSEEFVLHTKMMEEASEIIKILKSLDKYDIPNIDYFQVVKLRDEKKKEEETVKKTEKIELALKKQEKEKEKDVFIDDLKVDTKSSISFFEKENIKEKSFEKKSEFGDEIIKVGGVEKRFSEVTDADHDKMTEEEYTTYYKIFEQLQNQK